MDVIKQAGELALASRLRRLTERFAQDVGVFYQDRNTNFEPRWFPVYLVLHEKGALPIVDIAKELGITHPAVNQIASELIERGWVRALKDDQDKRKRLLTLTPAGQDLYAELKPVWDDIHAAAVELIASTGFDFMAAIERMEWELDHKDFYTRLREQQHKAQQDCVDIVEYQPELASYFATLNYEWIEQYFTVEKMDEEILANPVQYILEPGGFIFFARYAGNIVGTCALMKHGAQEFELGKMAVKGDVQGRQIGRKLLQTAIQKAKSLKAHKITLETNSKLTRAINLYRRCGFQSVPYEPGTSEFDRTDMRMELNLDALNL